MNEPFPASPRIAIDRLVDESLGVTGEGTVSSVRRLVAESVHFGVSVLGEGLGILQAAPGFLEEVLRSGVYPDQITFRKLPYLPDRSDLAMLKRQNPGWIFREDFDPRHWVIVFLHGYIDNTGAARVAYKLAELGYQVYLVRYPFLRSIRRLAGELAEVLERIARRERGKRLVPMGHSLGGFVWDHLLLHRPAVVERYRMPLYIAMGSPHFGTLAAHLGIGQSAREMLPASDIVRDHLRRRFPDGLEVYPFVSRFDLLVLPVETALVRQGINYLLSETGHIAQVTRSEVVTAVEEIFASPRSVLGARAVRRPFRLSAMSWLVNQLPRQVQQRLGLEGVLDYVLDGDQPPDFLIRIVHHEVRTGLIPALRRSRIY